MSPDDQAYLHLHPELDPARLGCATASCFGDILARGRGGQPSASRRNYAIQLALERTTGKTPSRFQGNAATNWGHETEELAIVEVMLRYPKLDIHPVPFVKHMFLMAGASLDQAIDDDGTLEAKCFNSANHYEALTTGLLPRDYIPQVQGQLWITERQYCLATMLDPDFPPESQLIIQRIERDQPYIDNLMVEVAKFLSEVDQMVEYITNYKGTL